VTILGTDINRHCLARAREGNFEEWAFRSTTKDLKASCFLKEGRLWKIAPEYKEWVSFQYHNLVEHSFPSPVNNLFCFDLIICRNVMIYFGPDLMQRMIRQFHDCLVPGAWLLVGPSEPNMTYFSSFYAVNAPGVTLYRKPEPSTPHQRVEAFTVAPLLPPPPVPDIDISAVAGPDGASDSPTLADLRIYADKGAWESAAKCCEQLLKKDNLNSAVHFYQGLVLEQMKRPNEAKKSMRRAIYLDRGFVLAHYYLGLCLQSCGDSRQAARSFENALELLRSRDDAGIFADADGLNAGELKKLAQMKLDILREKE
jgi:chemotaxis protein methyltransferase CheR